MQTLRLIDHADPELLAVLQDVADDDGWAHSDVIATEIGLDSSHPRANIGRRLGWMKKWGWVESHPKDHKWRLTAIGNSLIQGQLDREAQKLLRKLTPSERVQVTRLLSQHGNDANIALRSMLRREWQRNFR